MNTRKKSISFLFKFGEKQKEMKYSCHGSVKDCARLYMEFVISIHF